MEHGDYVVLGAWVMWTCDYMALDVAKNVAAFAADPGFPPASATATCMFLPQSTPVVVGLCIDHHICDYSFASRGLCI